MINNESKILRDEVTGYILNSAGRNTQRQIECCQLLLNGNTAKQIAGLLGLSSRTVEYYFGNIRTKLQCNNKAELIAKLTQLLKSK